MPVPVYALLPDPHAPEGFRVSEVPPNMHRVRFHVVGPVALHGGALIEALSLDVVRWGRAERLTRRERRRKARANGRRQAVAVPVETRWEARVAAHPDISERTVRRFVEEHAIVERLWERRRAT